MKVYVTVKLENIEVLDIPRKDIRSCKKYIGFPDNRGYIRLYYKDVEATTDKEIAKDRIKKLVKVEKERLKGLKQSALDLLDD